MQDIIDSNKGTYTKPWVFLCEYGAHVANRSATSPASPNLENPLLPSKLHSENHQCSEINTIPLSGVSIVSTGPAIALPRDDSRPILASLVQPVPSSVDGEFRVAYNELEVGNFSLLDYADCPETNCILLVECLSKTNPDTLQFSGRCYTPNTVTKRWKYFSKTCL